MSGFLDADWIRQVFLLAVRFVAALGGFVVGYVLSGPVATLLARLAFHKPLPQWSLAWCKVIGGIVVAVLVFWLLPIGGWGPGGGGKGSGGGTGDGKGTGSGQGTGTGSQAGKTNGKQPGDGTSKGLEDNGILVIEMCGPETAVEDKCYLINRQKTPVDFKQVEAYLKQHRQRITAMQVLFTEQSVSRNDPVVARLQDLARDQGLDPPTLKTVGGKKQ
jgi:hypothetical protein